MPIANGQSISTVTSIMNVTSSSVSTMLSSVQVTSTSVRPARYDWTPYGYDEKTGMFNLNQFKESYGGFKRGGGTDQCLYFDYFLLPVGKGDVVKGHFDGGKGAPVIFYILNQDQLKRFNHSYCGWDGWENSGWQVYALSDSYNLNWTVPQDGEYALLFISPTWYYYDTLKVSMNVYSQTVQSMSATFTLTKTYTVQSLQTALLTQPNTAQQQQPNQSGNSSLTPLLVVAAIAAACIGLAVMIMKQRNK